MFVKVTDPDLLDWLPKSGQLYVVKKSFLADPSREKILKAGLCDISYNLKPQKDEISYFPALDYVTMMDFYTHTIVKEWVFGSVIWHNKSSNLSEVWYFILGNPPPKLRPKYDWHVFFGEQ